MKMLLILWAIGLSKCDKLDRTYLPPSGSVAAGGSPEDLNLPLESNREIYFSTVEPGSDVLTTNESLSSKYPNVALGIDRQSPYVTASPTYFTNRPGLPVTKNINYDVPISSLRPTTSSPVGRYDTTVGPKTIEFQTYSTTASSFDPNLSYEKDLLEQIMKPKRPSQLVENVAIASRDPITNFSNKNIGQPSTYNSKPGNSNLQDKNIQQSQQSPSYGDYDRQEQVDRIGVSKSQPANVDLNIPSNTGEIGIGSTAINTAVPSSKYSSIPISSNDIYGTRYYTNNPPPREQAESDRKAVILDYQNIITPEGFAYSFDTSNGIHGDESGTAVDGVKAKGSYSYVGDDGKIYSIEYTADENGFLPRGDHLPTAPSIPDAILKGIELAEKNRKLGIIDDGSYDDAKYGHGRYQGVMGRIPQNQNKDFILDQSSLEENEDEIKTTSFDKDDLPTNNGDFVDKINYEFGGKPNSPDIAKESEVNNNKYPYAIGDSRVLPQLGGEIRPTGDTLLSSKVNVSNNLPTQTQLNEKFEASPVKNSEIFTPINKDLRKQYNDNEINMQYQAGYEYNTPHNMFSDNGVLKSDEAQSERTAPQNFVPSNTLFNVKNRKLDTNSQLPKKAFNVPIITSDNTDSGKMQNINIVEPSLNTPLFYNKGPGQIENTKDFIPARFSTIEPNYASTTLRPSYQSPYTITGNSKQRTNYPSSTPGSQYSVSTTPLPSKFSSSFIPSTSRVTYSETTPTIISQFTSTLKPSMTSGRPTSETTSRPSDYTGRTSGSEQVEDSRISSMKPNTFGQRTFKRPGYQGRTDKISVNRDGLSEDFRPGFGVPSDPRSQSFKVSSRPENIGSQSSTDRMFGEDFTGPQQSQKFDPQYGYYY